MEDINQATTETVTEAPTEATTEAPTENSERTAFLESLPEEYRDKNYFKNVNNLNDLLKNYDHSQQLIGRKKELNLPTEQSSPEEWKKYYDAIGRPEKSDGYKLEYPKEFSDIISPEDLTKFKELAHEQGMSEKQAQSLINYEVSLYQGLLEKRNQEQAEAEKQFQEVANSALGAEKEKVLENSELLVKKYMPQGMEEYFQGLDNNSKIIMASVINGIQKDYISEDTLSNSARDIAKENPDSMLAKAKELMSSKAYSNNTHSDHQRVFEEVQNIYKKVYG